MNKTKTNKKKNLKLKQNKKPNQATATEAAAKAALLEFVSKNLRHREGKITSSVPYTY